MQHGSVRQCARQCAAVRLAVCGCALGSVQQSGSMAVCGSKAACGSAAVCGNAALYGSARAAVCGSARGGVRECARQCAAVVWQFPVVRLAVCGFPAVRQCAAVR